jgi:hypothetical protein
MTRHAIRVAFWFRQWLRLRRAVLEPVTHALCEDTHADGGEEVDREASLGLVICVGWEDAGQTVLEHWILEALDD